MIRGHSPDGTATPTRPSRLLRAVLAGGLWVLALQGGCSSEGGAAARPVDAGSPPEAVDSSTAGFLGLTRGSRIFELREVVAEGAPVASNNYFCAACVDDPAAAAVFDAAAYPEGFALTPERKLVAARGRLFDPVNTRAAPVELDLLAEIPGAELRLGAQPLAGEFLGGSGIRVTMESSRRLEWEEGDVLELLDDGTDEYVLFAEVTDPAATPPAEIPLPPGWTHARRAVTEKLVLEAVPRVVVFLNPSQQHLWQRVTPPP